MKIHSLPLKDSSPPLGWISESLLHWQGVCVFCCVYDFSKTWLSAESLPSLLCHSLGPDREKEPIPATLDDLTKMAT